MSDLYFSLAGFDFLFEQLHGSSKDFLKKLIVEAYTPLEKRQRDFSETQNERKAVQYGGIIDVIYQYGLAPKRILEIGCGKGNFSLLLAKEFSIPIRGVDINSDLVNKAKDLGDKLTNFETRDASLPMKFDEDLVLGLHCCGNLSDKIILNAVSNLANVISAPCCFGKINQHEKVTPLSKTLSHRTHEIFYAIEQTRYLEGYVNPGKDNRTNVLLDGYRLLINIDRAIYLRENGYSSSLVEIVSEAETKQSPHNNTPVKTAIVGKKIIQ